jgi:hypothetical protein
MRLALPQIIFLEDGLMRTNRFLLVILLVIILAGLFSACGSRAAEVPDAATEESAVEATVEQAEESGDILEPTDTPSLGAYGQPIDVPIMDGHRDLSISRGGLNIRYTFDNIALQDMVTWYQENLTANGWHEGPNEDAVGSRNLYTLARLNDSNDRITVTMQYNSIGNFVVVTIVINRAP